MAVLGSGMPDLISEALVYQNATTYITDVNDNEISNGVTRSLTRVVDEVNMMGAEYDISAPSYPVGARGLSVGTPGSINSYTIAFDQSTSFTYDAPYGRYILTSLKIIVS